VEKIEHFQQMVLAQLAIIIQLLLVSWELGYWFRIGEKRVG
jgi:ABC-type iron transport system FetAB permease component